MRSPTRCGCTQSRASSMGTYCGITLVGCIIRDIFPNPEVVLYLTGTDQREFVAEFNTLLVEALAGTEIQTGQLLSA